MVGVNPIIPNIPDYNIHYIYASTKPFNAVIPTADDFNMFNGGTGTNGGKGEPIDLVARADIGATGCPDRDIAQHARLSASSSLHSSSWYRWRELLD